MSLEVKKKRLELMRVQTARYELEFKVEERLDEIRRLEEHIKIQKDKELELIEEIKKME
jgi:hypothetical protein